MARCLPTILATAVLLAQPRQSRTIRFTDLPPALADRFDPSTFDDRIQATQRDTDRREAEGELEHLIHFALQSGRFTSLPRIEPAVSAREFVETSRIPESARARLQALLRALAHPGAEPHLRYFATLVPPPRRTLQFLENEYARVMRFLYDKEFLRREHAYETRGHSTDTQVEANFAVWNALAVIRQLDPKAAIRRVLIIGPGLDFAPRTALTDSHPPQSFQPYALADALLSLGLVRRGQIAIDCGDINARVLEFLSDFPRGNRTLELHSGAGDREYLGYFHALGGAIGARSGAKLQVDLDVARAIHAARLNILTTRWTAAYDLIVATNVLVYFNSDELALALANIAAMLPPGGYFLHNELRPELDQIAAAAALHPVQARTIRLADGLYDAFAIYRK